MDKQEKQPLESEDVGDLLKIIEKSYDIRFEENELRHVRTFGQLSDHIISKIKLEDKQTVQISKLFTNCGQLSG